MFRLGGGLRQLSAADSSSHLQCWMVCDALTIAKAS